MDPLKLRLSIHLRAQVHTISCRSGVPLQQHLRTKYSDKCRRAMALPVTCTGTLDGDGDLGSDMGRAQYTVYLCPTGALDPMSAVMMCGQVCLSLSFTDDL
jgi:hypothetical protein